MKNIHQTSKKVKQVSNFKDITFHIKRENLRRIRKYILLFLMQKKKIVKMILTHDDYNIKYRAILLTDDKKCEQKTMKS